MALVASTAILIAGAQPNAIANDMGCPQTSAAWLLYEDDNPAPDFWEADSVEVQAIEICQHGVNFFFVGEQDGQQYYIAFVFVKPTRELYETRLAYCIRGVSAADWLTQAQHEYDDLVSRMRALFGDALVPTGRIDFANERPAIFPGCDLFLRWRGSDYGLRGYFDVYLALML